MKDNIKVFALISVFIGIYYLVYHIYIGIINPIPALGDSWDYHIPIAQTILDGRFLFPENFRLPQWYYPGSAELFLAAFIFFHIPLTLSNILATIVLFFCLWKLGMVLRLSYYFALLFAVTFCTFNGVIRWMNAISIDMWMAVFFTLSLILLERPQRDILYFAKIGVVLGMMIGSKYTGILFVIILVLIYGRTLKRYITFLRSIVFLIPFSLFGLFWYVRNYIFLDNPFYPLDVLGFKGTNLFSDTIWQIAFKYPVQMFDAGFSEYKIWLLVIPIAIGWLFYNFVWSKKFLWDNMNKLFILGIINLFLFVSFPTSSEAWIMVSSFRYSYPVFIPLLLGLFLLAQRYKKEDWVGYIAIGSMVMVTSLGYYPKLALVYIPLGFLAIYTINKYGKANSHKKL